MKESSITFRVKTSLKERAEQRAREREESLSAYLTGLMARDLKRKPRKT